MTHCKVFENVFVSVETMAQFELSNSELSQRCKRLYGDLLFLTKANYLIEDIRFFIRAATLLVMVSWGLTCHCLQTLIQLDHVS